MIIKTSHTNQIYSTIFLALSDNTHYLKRAISILLVALSQNIYALKRIIEQIILALSILIPELQLELQIFRCLTIRYSDGWKKQRN